MNSLSLVDGVTASKASRLCGRSCRHGVPSGARVSKVLTASSQALFRVMLISFTLPLDLFKKEPFLFLSLEMVHGFRSMPRGSELPSL